MRDYDELHKLWARAHKFGSPTKFVRNVVVFSELNKLVLEKKNYPGEDISRA